MFTSGATESDNLAIKGVAEYLHEKGNHIVTVVTEHKAVLDPCKYLERHGCEVTCLPVRRQRARHARAGRRRDHRPRRCWSR